MIERKALRFSPAGVPVGALVSRGDAELGFQQLSELMHEDGVAIGLGKAARWLQAATPGVTVQLTGFLAARSQNSKQLRLHVTMIEFVEGNQNG